MGAMRDFFLRGARAREDDDANGNAAAARHGRVKAGAAEEAAAEEGSAAGKGRHRAGERADAPDVEEPASAEADGGGCGADATVDVDLEEGEPSLSFSSRATETRTVRSDGADRDARSAPHTGPVAKGDTEAAAPAGDAEAPGCAGSRVHSLQPTKSLRGGGVILSNSAPRRAASGMWAVLMWMGNQLSAGYRAWERLRRDEPVVGFFVLLLSIAFIAVVVLPAACIVFVIFALLFCVAYMFDAICL